MYMYNCKHDMCIWVDVGGFLQPNACQARRRQKHRRPHRLLLEMIVMTWTFFFPPTVFT